MRASLAALTLLILAVGWHEAAGQQGPNGCPVKGNVNSKGERIYHVAGGRFYERVKIKPKEGDRCFRTPQEAQAAGFRPSQR